MKKQSILLIEDNHVDARLIEKHFSNRFDGKYDFTHAERLSEGLKCIGRDTILVLLGLNLPKSEGLKTLDRVREAAGDIPVILLTSSKSGDIGVEAIQRGAQDYLVKTDVDGALLSHSITHAIERAALQRELRDQASRLKESEKRFRSMVDENADGIIIVDKNGIIRFANPSAEKLLGRRKSDLIGEQFGFPVGIGKTSEIEILGRGGKRIYAEMRVSSIDWENNEAFLASIRDVTASRNAEKALAREKNLLRTLVDTIPDAVYVKDAESRFLLANDATRRIMNAESVKNLIGKTDQDFYLDEQAAHYLAEEREIIKTGCPVIKKEDVIKRGAEIKRWFLHTKVPLRDGEDNIIGTIGISRDISYEKKTEQEIQILHRLLKTANRHTAMEPLLEEYLREIKKIVDCEAVGIRVVNMNSEIFRGFPDMRSGSGTTHECLLDEGRNALCAGVLEGTMDKGLPFLTVNGSFLTKNMSGIIRDLATPEKERWGLDLEDFTCETLAVIPIRSSEKPLGVLIAADRRGGMITDEVVSILEQAAMQLGAVIQRLYMEEVLKESARKFSTLFNSASDSILIHDLAGRIIEVNEAACLNLGFAREDLLRKSLLDVTRKDSTYLFKTLAETLKEKGHSIFEHELTRSDGTGLPVEINSKIIDFEGKKVVLSIARDIQERKKLENQLLQSQKMEAIGRLAGGIAHDFNNMLTAVIGYSDYLLMQVDGEGQTHSIIKEIRAAGERASALARQLLIFSRRQYVEPKILNINTVLGEMQKMLERVIGEDIMLDLSLAKKLDTVRMDQSQVEQVIMNLVINAKDAMLKGGELFVKTENIELDEVFCRERMDLKPGPFIKLSISDTGTGIEKTLQEKIFDPFFTTKEVGKGTGLGLSIVYSIVKQNGGEILLFSAPGEGSTFDIYIPVSRESAPEHYSGDLDTDAHRGSGSILVVEDEPAVREIVSTILKDTGYDVFEASNGREALDRYGEHPEHIDLLITDVVMPEMYGTQLAETLRETRPDMNVLFISGYTDASIQERTLLEEDAHFLQKPFKPKFLLKKIEEILTSRG